MQKLWKVGAWVLAAAAWPAQAQSGYTAIDAYAKATPVAQTETIERLAAHLAKAGATRQARARAVYTWVALNLRYDAALFEAHKHQVNIVEADKAAQDPRIGGQSAAVVLRSHTALCLGYSHLVEALCKQMAIPAFTVSGLARSWHQPLPAAASAGPNHAWNVVKTEAGWQLMDATWAAGYLDPTGQFVPRFSDSLFAPDPVQFGATHWPSDPAFQLVAAPQSKAAFLAREKLPIGTAKAGYAFADTLDKAAAQPVSAFTYASARRALAFDPEAVYARLKLTEYHASGALAALENYRLGIKAASFRQGEAAPPALIGLLDSAETHLRASKRLLEQVPAAQQRQLPAIRQNLASLEANLQAVAQQRQFWAKLQAQP